MLQIIPICTHNRLLTQVICKSTFPMNVLFIFSYYMAAESKDRLIQKMCLAWNITIIMLITMAMRPTNLTFHFDVDQAFISSSRNCLVRTDSGIVEKFLNRFQLMTCKHAYVWTLNVIPIT